MRQSKKKLYASIQRNKRHFCFDLDLLYMWQPALAQSFYRILSTRHISTKLLLDKLTAACYTTRVFNLLLTGITTMAKVRISKKLLAQYPIEVAEYIVNRWGEYVKSVTIEHHNAPYTLYNGEGYHFFVYHNGEAMSLETVSSNTIGAAGLNHDINGSTVIPAGTIIVQVTYYAGYMMRIIHVDPVAISAPRLSHSDLHIL
jgi:hypothetical protein